MKRTKKIFLISFFAVLIFGITVIIYSFWVIYQDTKTLCLKAQEEYKENCVNSLIKLVQSENKTFKEKNSAIWALGQMADKKALPFLYELDKSLPEQEKCGFDDYLCKYEVQKAIKWCERGNVTNWMYRNRGSWYK